MLAASTSRLNALLSQLKGRIPNEDCRPAPPVTTMTTKTCSRIRWPARRKMRRDEGDQMQMPLSPDEAGQILDGLSLDGSRRLLMTKRIPASRGKESGLTW